MKKLKQQGFSAVVVLLVLILVAIVGFAGYYVYTQQNKKAETKQAVAETKKTEAAQSATPAPAADTTKYLVIKEWGVKVPLTKNIEDAYYYYKKYDGGDSVYVSTKSITAKYPDCAADKTTIYAYGRFSDGNKVIEPFNQTYSQRYPGATKVDNYYYYTVHPQAACFETLNKTSAEITNLQKTEIQPLMDAFVAALAKVQAE